MALNRLIWLDQNTGSVENICYKEMFGDIFQDGFDCTGSVETCMTLIKHSVKVILVVSDSLADIILPKIGQLE